MEPITQVGDTHFQLTWTAPDVLEIARTRTYSNGTTITETCQRSGKEAIDAEKTIREYAI